MAYRETSVSVEKSKEEIRKILVKAGVRGVQMSENFRDRKVNVKFAKDIEGNLRTVSITMVIPAPTESKRNAPIRRYNRHLGRYVTYEPKNKLEQNERATYRALHYWLKSQFEAVEYGLISFEDIFLSHFEWMVEGKKTTVGELVKPRLANGNYLLGAPKREAEEVVDGHFTES